MISLALALLIFTSLPIAAAMSNTTAATASPFQDRRSRVEGDFNDSIYHPITNDNIHHAVREWMKDREATRLLYGHIKDWDTSSITDMSSLFSWERSNSLAQFRDNITVWNTSQVVNMTKIFYGNSAMNLDFSQWDVSRVLDMSFAFASTKHYAGHDLGTWDTSKLINSSNMFYKANAFNSNSIHNWDVRSLVDASRMFYEAQSFHSEQKWRWNTHNLQDMNEMFALATSFVGDLSAFNTSSVTSMKGTFFKASQFNSDLANFETDNVKDMNSMFAHASSFEGKGLERWNVAKVTNMANMLKRTAFDQDLSSWQVEAVTDMRNMFRYASLMNQKVCWNLNPNVTLEGIFFQSQGSFDRSCVDHKYVIHSCCQPDIDNACRCGETTKYEDHGVESDSNHAVDPSLASQAQHDVDPSLTSQTQPAKPFLEEPQYLMAAAVACIFVLLSMLASAIRRFRRRNSLTTTIIDCGEVDEIDFSDLGISPSTTPFPLTFAARENVDFGSMEHIPVQEIV